MRSSPAEASREASSARQPLRTGRLPPTDDPQGVYVRALIEFERPREMDGRLAVDRPSIEALDDTGCTNVHDLNHPLTCDQGPPLTREEVCDDTSAR